MAFLEARSDRAKLDTLLAVDLITLPLFVYLLGVALYGLAIQEKLCSKNVSHMSVLVAFGTVGEVAMLPFEYRLLLDSPDHHALAWQQWLIVLGVFATLFLAGALGIALSVHMFTALLTPASSEDLACRTDESVIRPSFTLGTIRAGLPRLGLCQRRSLSSTKSDGYKQLLAGDDAELV